MTRQGEIVEVVSAAMFPGDDVFYVMCYFAIALVQPTVLTTFASPLSHKPP